MNDISSQVLQKVVKNTPTSSKKEQSDDDSDIEITYEKKNDDVLIIDLGKSCNNKRKIDLLVDKNASCHGSLNPCSDNKVLENDIVFVRYEKNSKYSKKIVASQGSKKDKVDSDSDVELLYEKSSDVISKEPKSDIDLLFESATDFFSSCNKYIDKSSNGDISNSLYAQLSSDKSYIDSLCSDNNINEVLLNMYKCNDPPIDLFPKKCSSSISCTPVFENNGLSADQSNFMNSLPSDNKSNSIYWTSLDYHNRLNAPLPSSEPCTNSILSIQPSSSFCDWTQLDKNIKLLCSKCSKFREYDIFSFCENNHPTCSICLADVIKTVLAKSIHMKKLCPWNDCKGVFSKVELLKSVPSMIVDILEEKNKNHEIQRITSELKEKSLGGVDFLAGLPTHWAPLSESRGYKVVQIESDGIEYLELAILFYQSLFFPKNELVRIYRVQNPFLWHFYSSKKSQMTQESGGISYPTELQLFHGTLSKHLNAICKDNFDWRLSGKNGQVYGKGSYFAKNASYSHKYCDSLLSNTALQDKLPSDVFIDDWDGDAFRLFVDYTRHKHFLVVAKVLVGTYTCGHSKFVKPPPHDTQADKFFDSCVDCIADPKIHVIFDSSQSYPEYIIEYTRITFS